MNPGASVRYRSNLEEYNLTVVRSLSSGMGVHGPLLSCTARRQNTPQGRSVWTKGLSEEWNVKVTQRDATLLQSGSFIFPVRKDCVSTTSCIEVLQEMRLLLID